MFVWLGVVSALASGWRGDGTAVHQGALADRYDLAQDVAWKQAAPAPGNASLVRVGDVLCGTAEPDVVFCVDADTGALRWQQRVRYADTVAPSERAAVEAKLAESEAAEARVGELRRDFGRLQRDARRGGAGDDVWARLEAVQLELQSTMKLAEETAQWRTPPITETIGYASPTPTTDGTHLFVAFGHGLVASFSPSGERKWAVWLGPPAERMRGYDEGQTASPQWVRGVLVVPHGRLRGLDPADGSVRWEGPEYADYGTPAVMEVGSGAWLATPAGELVSAASGEVVARDLGDVWYTGPVVHGADLVYLGGRVDGGAGSEVYAVSWHVTAKGDSVSVQPRWRERLDFKERVYAPPVRVGDRWVTAGRDRTLLVVDDTTGKSVKQQPIEGVQGEFWSSPLVVGDRILLATERGELVVLDRDLTPRGVTRVEAMRASPLVLGRRLWLRTQQHVMQLVAR